LHDGKLMKIGFVELDDTIVVPADIHADRPGSINIVLTKAGTSTLEDGELLLEEGEGTFSIKEDWFSNSQVIMLEPGAGKFRLTDRRLSIIRPVTRSAIPGETELDPIRRSLLIDAARAGRSEYAEIPIDEIRGYVGNRLLITCKEADQDAQLVMDMPEGPGSIVDNIPRIKRFTQDDVKKHLPAVITGRHKQIRTYKHDAAAIALLVMACIFSLAWLVPTGAGWAQFLSVVLFVLAFVVVARRLRIPHSLRVGQDGVTLFSYLGQRHLQYSDIDRLTTETEYAERYEQDTLDDVSRMVTKEFHGIRINYWGDMELFVAADLRDAVTAYSCFLEMAPRDTRRDIAGAEATETDRRRLQEMADRLPKKIRNANAINAVIVAMIFVLVVWMYVQNTPDINLRNEPLSVQRKILEGSIFGAVFFGFEFIGFGYYYGNHAEFQIDSLTGKIAVFNARSKGPQIDLDLGALEKPRRLTLRTGLAGLVTIGIMMLGTALFSFTVPSMAPLQMMAFGLAGAIMVGAGTFALFKV